MNDYFIKKGYQGNLNSQGRAMPYLDDKHSSSSYQVKVYEFAKRVIKNHKLESVLDVGCGFGLKLKDIIHPVCENIVGIDTSYAINFCRQEHHFGKWLEDNVDKPTLNLNKRFDLIISSDVIEHLTDPDKLLAYIKNYSHNNTHVIISTTERDLTRGKMSLGPPANLAHVREWNLSEFREYISSRGFKIIKHFLVGERGQSLIEIIKKLLLFRPLVKCQVIYCKIEP